MTLCLEIFKTVSLIIEPCAKSQKVVRLQISWSKSFFSLIWLWMKSRPSSTLWKERSHSLYEWEPCLMNLLHFKRNLKSLLFPKPWSENKSKRGETPRPKGAAPSNTISPIPFPKIPTWELNPRKSKRKSYKNPNSLGKPIKGILVWLCCYCPMDWNFPPSMISKPQQSSTLQISLFLKPAPKLRSMTKSWLFL